MTMGLGELTVSLGMAVAAGLVGCFAVMRKMTLASDAISHVALPGIGIALILQLPPWLGGIATLLLGTLLVWVVQSKTRIATETVIGVVFSGALAVGALITEGESLIEALFGGPGALTGAEIAFGVTAAAGVTVFILYERHRLVIALVSRDMARTAGIDVSRLDLWYLVMFSITVALGLRYLGVLLMGSLLIIPAATAKHLARGLSAMLVIAVSLAVFATVTGAWLAHALQRETGPVIITIAAALFFASLLRPTASRTRRSLS
jgi:ABC-type Mn2+/Zn2+ transport system permease subunit